jgi:hypothetical protein
MNQDPKKSQLKVILQYKSLLVASQQRIREHFIKKHKTDIQELARRQYVVNSAAYHTFLSATAFYLALGELNAYLEEWQLVKDSVMKHNQCVRMCLNHNITRDRFYTHILMMDEVKTEEPAFYKLATEIRGQLNMLRMQLEKAKTSKVERVAVKAKSTPAKKAVKRAAKKTSARKK